MTRLDWLDQALWPPNSLGELLEALASSHGLQAADSALHPARDVTNPSDGQAAEWLAWAAGRIGIEALPVARPFANCHRFSPAAARPSFASMRMIVRAIWRLLGSRSGKPQFFARVMGGCVCRKALSKRCLQAISTRGSGQKWSVFSKRPTFAANVARALRTP
ncbi:MAG: hypothetical protein IPK89_06765 [Sphingomonadales bacterium]|nr:hypothetical protein [Sphingomonadales bacterium]